LNLLEERKGLKLRYPRLGLQRQPVLEGSWKDGRIATYYLRKKNCYLRKERLIGLDEGIVQGKTKYGTELGDIGLVFMEPE